MTGQPTAGSGTSASLFGTATRSDGNPQVAYNGHPLYTYVGDQQAGQSNGQGITAFGGSWFTLDPSGTQVSGPASGGGTSSPGGVGGYQPAAKSL